MVVHAHLEKDPTLHLPRILCLHGGGTNARIFRMQCRVIERFLRPTFRLVYPEGPFPAQAGPDVTTVYKEYGPFKSWLRWMPGDPERDSPDVISQINRSLSSAMKEDDLKGATGEWVALLGFSQGAKICASILISQQLRMERSGASTGWPQFSFAVLLAGRGPPVWLTPDLSVPRGFVDAACHATLACEPVLPASEHILRVPTIHVHGLEDPGLELHRKFLNRYCDPKSVTVLEWDGEHRVPIKTKDVSAVVEQIYSMARTTGVLNWGDGCLIEF